MMIDDDDDDEVAVTLRRTQNGKFEKVLRKNPKITISKF